MFSAKSLFLLASLVQIAFTQLAFGNGGIQLGNNLANYANGPLNGIATNAGTLGANLITNNLGLGLPITPANGVGDVTVGGELAVGGSTAIAGNVPVIGYVAFEGVVPAGGLVSLANSCGCNGVI